MLLSLGMHAQHMFIVIKQTCMSIFMKLHYSSINAFMSLCITIRIRLFPIYYLFILSEFYMKMAIPTEQIFMLIVIYLIYSKISSKTI